MISGIAVVTLLTRPPGREFQSRRVHPVSLASRVQNTRPVSEETPTPEGIAFGTNNYTPDSTGVNCDKQALLGKGGRIREAGSVRPTSPRLPLDTHKPCNLPPLRTADIFSRIPLRYGPSTDNLIPCCVEAEFNVRLKRKGQSAALNQKTQDLEETCNPLQLPQSSTRMIHSSSLSHPKHIRRRRMACKGRFRPRCS